MAQISLLNVSPKKYTGLPSRMITVSLTITGYKIKSHLFWSHFTRIQMKGNLCIALVLSIAY